MASRYFFALCALALIAAVVAAPVEEVDVDDVETEDAERGLKAKVAAFLAEQLASYLNKHYIKIKFECIPDAVTHCNEKINFFAHPQKYYRCGRNYFESHPERCMKQEKN